MEITENEEKGQDSVPEGPEQLYDVLIPPGVPRSIIVDVVKKFDVEVVERKQRLYYANMDGDEREILAFRGRREVVVEVEKFMFSQLKEFIGDL
ncbi:MAG TPA: hypothetical protein VMW63_10905 [Methanoregulaceae archaeon]|nr:hypothetical protein [Methanoregulaceae archaeon]